MLAVKLLSDIEPLTKEDQAVNEARKRLHVFFSNLYEDKKPSMSKEQIEADVGILRAFLVEKFNAKANQEYLHQSGLDLPLYQTLLLLAQCFPLNDRDTEQHFLTRNYPPHQQRKIPIKNRFIASDGYWYFIPNSEMDSDFETAYDFIVFKDKPGVSKRDRQRFDRLRAQWPDSREEQEMLGSLHPISMFVGFAAFFALIGLMVFAGLATGAGFVVLALMFIVPAGPPSIIKTFEWFLFLHKRSKPYQSLEKDPDFSMEENKILALFGETAETSPASQRPFFSFGFKENLKKSAAVGLSVGFLLGYLAAATLLLINPPFMSLFLMMCVLCIPIIAGPLLCCLGAGMYHLKEYLGAPKHSKEVTMPPISSKALSQLHEDASPKHLKQVQQNPNLAQGQQALGDNKTPLFKPPSKDKKESQPTNDSVSKEAEPGP